MSNEPKQPYRSVRYEKGGWEPCPWLDTRPNGVVYTPSRRMIYKFIIDADGVEWGSWSWDYGQGQ